jgi:lipopolysaccharide export system protein LptA
MNPGRARRTRHLAGAVIAGLLLLTAVPAAAEKADSDQPLQIESDRMSANDLTKEAMFEGDVVLTKGSIRLTADRIVVKEQDKGSHHAVATGNPVRFRQRMDSKEGKAPVWVDGEAQRIEYDEGTEKVELFDKARVNRDGDEVRGDYILYDQRTEYFSVRGGKGSSSGRVRAIIQPKTTQERPDRPPSNPAPPAR